MCSRVRQTFAGENINACTHMFIPPGSIGLNDSKHEASGEQ